MRPNANIAERISVLRNERKWTQTHLARQVGTNVKTIKDWENGVSLPSVHNIRKLCEIFSTTSDYLLGLENTPTIKLSGLPEDEVIRIRLVVQILIETASKKSIKINGSSRKPGEFGEE